MTVCFVLKLSSHISSIMLLLTHMRSGISHGDEMMSTTFLLNSISYFLLYLQNATNILIVHRRVLLDLTLSSLSEESVVLGDDCH